MNRVIKITIPAFVIAILWMACAPKIYQPPHLGAEYRFDEGLKPEKPREQLFSKNMHKYLRETGVEQQPLSKPNATIVKQTVVHQKAASDSTQRDTATTLAPASLTASPDSSHNVQK